MELRRLFLNIVVLSVILAMPVIGSENKPLGIDQKEYAARRAAVLARMDTSSILVMKAADLKERNGDVEYRYRQESNFQYLVGPSRRGTLVMFVPRGISIDGKTARCIIFSPSKTRGKEEFVRWNDQIADEVELPAARFSEMLLQVMPPVKTLYVSAPGLGFTNDWLNGKPLFLDREMKKRFGEQYPDVAVKPASALITPLREVKSAGEIALMRHAIAITGDGIRRAMKSCKPGVWEYALQADVEFEFTRQGAEYPSFPSIVGSGPNSLIPHYDDNRRMMKAGEVVVMDVGAEYDGYAADITRTLPVSGKFTESQKKVYDVVLDAHNAAIRAIHVGLPVKELDRIAKQSITQAGYGTFLLHGITHPVGLDVHDVAGSDTLLAGQIITIEPGIYIPASDTTQPPDCRGMGIRIEDDVMVMAGGPEVLSKDIPSKTSDIEAVMAGQ